VPAAIRDPRLAASFGGAAVPVPVPGSAPSGGTSWAAQLAFALREVGLASRSWASLRRQVAVRKSATALSGIARVCASTMSHSLWPQRPPALKRIVLIDDVITRARTLLAAAARMLAALPHADIRAFALIRTLGVGQAVTQLIEPCHGVVRGAGEDARREP
jgi:predicted amidophosphoribosyltransferase